MIAHSFIGASNEISYVLKLLLPSARRRWCLPQMGNPGPRLTPLGKCLPNDHVLACQCHAIGPKGSSYAFIHVPARCFAACQHPNQMWKSLQDLKIEAQVDPLFALFSRIS